MILRSIKEKVLLNFGSTVLPMSAGLIAIPVLIDKMGVERFGLLSIAWMIVGYFGLLDMGLGRALTQRIAANLGAGQPGNIRSLVRYVLKIVLALGAISAFSLYLFTEYLVLNVFEISQDYEAETIASMHWIALMIPLVILSTALFGVLEGFQFFGWIALIRLPLNILMFLAPIIAVYIENTLDTVIISLGLVRLVTFAVLAFIVFLQLNVLDDIKLSKEERRALLTFGGWITLSNIVSPVMVYFDRFFIAAVLGASWVAYYTTPLDFLVKATLIPLAIIGVMFSYFATHWQSEREKVIHAYNRTIIAISLIMFFFFVAVYCFAEIGISIWISESFAAESYVVAQIVALGVLFNGIAMVPYALVQGVGRADITGKFHLLELPVFATLLVLGVQYYGLQGAAWAWTVRVILDCLLLNIAAYYIVKDARENA